MIEARQNSLQVAVRNSNTRLVRGGDASVEDGLMWGRWKRWGRLRIPRASLLPSWRHPPPVVTLDV
jgi:hypothetical protein